MGYGHRYCLLDEPTANLDYNAINELEHALKVLKAQGKTIVINEHRLYYLSEIADEYWQMENGKIKQKLSGKEMASFSVEKLNEMGLRTNSLSSLLYTPLLDNRERTHQIVIENISFKYKKAYSEILQDFSAQGKTGDVIAVIGGNGCGKTTLGKAIAGLIKPQKGKVVFDGKTLTKKEQTAKSIFIMQETEFQFFTNSVYKELTYGELIRE